MRKWNYTLPRSACWPPALRAHRSNHIRVDARSDQVVCDREVAAPEETENLAHAPAHKGFADSPARLLRQPTEPNPGR